MYFILCNFKHFSEKGIHSLLQYARYVHILKLDKDSRPKIYNTFFGSPQMLFLFESKFGNT